MPTKMHTANGRPRSFWNTMLMPITTAATSTTLTIERPNPGATSPARTRRARPASVKPPYTTITSTTVQVTAEP